MSEENTKSHAWNSNKLLNAWHTGHREKLHVSAQINIYYGHSIEETFNWVTSGGRLIGI